MDIKINPRGNGACPLCRKHERCIILKAFSKSVEEIKRPDHIEVVVYSCPEFEETA